MWFGKEVTIHVSDSLIPGEKSSELLSWEMNPGPLNKPLSLYQLGFLGIHVFPLQA